MKKHASRVSLCLLITAAMLSGGCTKDSNGTGNQGGAAHITAKMNGAAWTATSDVFFVNNDLIYGTSGGLFGGLQIEGGLGDGEFMSIKVNKAKADSFNLTANKLDNFISFEKGDAYYSHRSGKIKVTNVTPTLVEGEFEAVLVQDGDGPNPGSALTITEGKFSASVNPGVL